MLASSYLYETDEDAPCVDNVQPYILGSNEPVGMANQSDNDDIYVSNVLMTNAAEHCGMLRCNNY